MTTLSYSNQIPLTSITECGISDATDFECLWSLPNLPLTERLGPFVDRSSSCVDQELLISVPTGHVQLRNQIDPRILYTATSYAFRTSVSGVESGVVTAFRNYLDRFVRGRHFRSAVDIGGNDSSMARNFTAFADQVAVIDPVADLDSVEIGGNIRVISRFVENVDLAAELDRPDLVVCRHTLEHVASPKRLISQLFSQCDGDCLYVFEVPCLEGLVEASRFDAVIHQHYHYFDIYSFKRLLWECGGECLDFAYNYQGSCGGAMYVAFRRAKVLQAQPIIALASRIKQIKYAISGYTINSTQLGREFERLPRPIFGYGASLMLATFGYHLNVDFGNLECILDDNPSRDGSTYENVPVRVVYSGNFAAPLNSSFIVTSLENARVIYSKIVKMQPRRILLPVVS